MLKLEELRLRAGDDLRPPNQCFLLHPFLALDLTLPFERGRRRHTNRRSNCLKCLPS